MSTYSLCHPMTDRSDFKINGLQASESAFDPRQVLVGLDRFFRIEILARHAGANDIDAVEPSFFFDPLDPALEGEMAVADLDGKMLGHFACVHNPADRHADLGSALEAGAFAPDPCPDAGKLAFGGRQQRLALARPFGRKIAIAANDQPFSREQVGSADLGEVALIKQR